MGSYSRAVEHMESTNTDISSFYKHERHESTEDETYGGTDSCDDSRVSTTNSELHNSNDNGAGKTNFKNKLIKDKTCSVCGDKALGYNFNAISCESCKAFFRRNAGKTIKGRCEGKCDVTIESRSYCKKCRLAKCFRVGMKKDLILSESQKQMRRQKIVENRMRRHGIPTPTSALTSAGNSNTSVSPPEIPNNSIPGSAGSSINDDDALNSKHVFTPEIDMKALEDLGESCRGKIAEVMRAFQMSFDSPVNYDPKQTPSSSTEFLNMADLSVRRLVKMAKNLQTFRGLLQEDQISLLKGAVVEVLILRSTKMFDPSQMAWSLKKDGEERKVSAIAFKFGTGEDVSFFEQYQSFTRGVLVASHMDPVVLMLMITLSVFSPDRSNLENNEMVYQAQEEYALILKEFCAVRYPTDKVMFPKILQKLSDIREINETHTRMLMHMKVDELGPLIIEIFNLSSR